MSWAISEWWQPAELIEECRSKAHVRAERLAWLKDELARRPVKETVGFQACLDRLCEQAFTRDLWAAAERIFGGWCSDDGFCYRVYSQCTGLQPGGEANL
ncbi:DUF4240 domain-containing protein [Streptomyces sp. NPDC003720]|uniref:DUF4240 domain-containing protein n=1 Tax=Streptomyces sp. NPDC003720 TaxID=3364684 RepID=UPI0036CD3880